MIVIECACYATLSRILISAPRISTPYELDGSIFPLDATISKLELFKLPTDISPWRVSGELNVSLPLRRDKKVGKKKEKKGEGGEKSEREGREEDVTATMN